MKYTKAILYFKDILKNYLQDDEPKPIDINDVTSFMSIDETNQFTFYLLDAGDYVNKVEVGSSDYNYIYQDFLEEFSFYQRELYQDVLAKINELKLKNDIGKEIKEMIKPIDFNELFANESNDNSSNAFTTDSIGDSLIMSLTNKGKVDIEYMATITNKEKKDIVRALRGSAIFQNPKKFEECYYLGYETREEYLSGNLYLKYKEAKQANILYDDLFDVNIKAIEEVMPSVVKQEEIYVSLGSPWVPERLIENFCNYLNQTDGKTNKITHNKLTGHWTVIGKWFFKYAMQYGTNRMSPTTILEKTLNNQPIIVYKHQTPFQIQVRAKKEIDQEETLLAIQKQKQLIKAFQDWLFADKRRAKEIQDIYYTRFCCNRKRCFDGSFLTFPGMNPNITLASYQKNAVARILFSNNVLLAHDVGVGKTYEMVAAIQELRRMHLSNKNMVVVPNNIIGQWKTMYLELYPDANILVVDNKLFNPAKRQETLKNIQDNDYDAIIIDYSSFEMIPLSFDFYKQQIEDEIMRLKDSLKDDDGSSHTRKKLERLEEKYHEEFENVSIVKKADIIYFDELGINHLFIDEAHNFKNIPLESNSEGVLGINKTGSSKCFDMLNKVHLVQKNNFGKGVVFATGTPITNSITDAFVMQKYLQDGDLRMLDLGTFDAWIGMFAEATDAFEIDPTATSYRLTRRYNKFHNLPELASIFSNIVDFCHINKKESLPEFNGYRDIIIPQSSNFDMFLQEISNRADNIKKGNPRILNADEVAYSNGKIKPKKDNMLVITTDGRKGALDLRLINPDDYYYEMESKVAYLTKKVVEVYNEYNDIKATQLIFCDVSTPKDTFNMYDEIKKLLILRGILANEIAYIHEAESNRARKKLFGDINEGIVRVLIGSSFKLGIGANVQNRLIAIHHIDVPWRPSDMIQREGRLIRQGNTNKEVFIYRYIKKNSFDAYSWQILENKQYLISKILNDTIENREASDVDNTVLDYGEVKALAIGNPLIKSRVETFNELKRYLLIQKTLDEKREALRIDVESLQKHLPSKKERLSIAFDDLTYIKSIINEDTKFEENKEFKDLIEASINATTGEEHVITNYYGFDIVCPASLNYGDKYVYLKKNGSYRVSLSESAVGNVARINNFLRNFEKYYLDIYTQVEQDEEFIKNGLAELNREEDYHDNIFELQNKLEEIDKELGV